MRRSTLVFLCPALCWWGLACEPPASPEVCALGAEDLAAELEPEPLVEAGAWEAGAGDLDPLASHRPEPWICPPGSWGEEFGALEVSTGACNYLHVEQPLRVDLARGDQLRVQLWWSGLLAPEPAIAHLALLVEGELLWEREVEVPGPAAAHELEFPSPITAEVGARVIFHLHNHGQNSWTLAALERVASAPLTCTEEAE